MEAQPVPIQAHVHNRTAQNCVLQYPLLSSLNCRVPIAQGGGGGRKEAFPGGPGWRRSQSKAVGGAAAAADATMGRWGVRTRFHTAHETSNYSIIQNTHGGKDKYMGHAAFPIEYTAGQPAPSPRGSPDFGTPSLSPRLHLEAQSFREHDSTSTFEKSNFP